MGNKLIEFPGSMSDSFYRDFKALLSLSAAHLRELAEALETAGELPLPEAVQQRLATSLGVESDKVRTTASLCLYLYKEGRARGLRVGDLVDELDHLGQTKGVPALDDEKKEALNSLLGANPRYDELVAELELHGAFLPRFRGVSAALDLRPLQEPGGGSVVSYLPLILLRIETWSEDKGSDSIVFEMREESLAETVTNLTRLQEKVKALRAEVRDKVELFPRLQDTQVGGERR